MSRAPEGDLLPVDLQEMVGEARRELQMRKQVYGNAVRRKQMNAKLADRRIDVMQAILEKLEAELDAHPELRR